MWETKRLAVAAVVAIVTMVGFDVTSGSDRVVVTDEHICC